MVYKCTNIGKWRHFRSVYWVYWLTQGGEVMPKSETQTGRLKALWHQSGGTLQPDALLQQSRSWRLNQQAIGVFKWENLLKIKNTWYRFQYFSASTVFLSIKNASNSFMLPEHGQDSVAPCCTYVLSNLSRPWHQGRGRSSMARAGHRSPQKTQATSSTFGFEDVWWCLNDSNDFQTFWIFLVSSSWWFQLYNFPMLESLWAQPCQMIMMDRRRWKHRSGERDHVLKNRHEIPMVCPWWIVVIGWSFHISLLQFVCFLQCLWWANPGSNHPRCRWQARAWLRAGEIAMANLVPIDTCLSNHVVYVSCLQMPATFPSSRCSRGMNYLALYLKDWGMLFPRLGPWPCDILWYPRCGFMTLLKELGILQVPTTLPCGV